MDKTLRTRLSNTLTACRKLLGIAISKRLEGEFDIFQNGMMENAALLGHLSDENQDNRQQLVIQLKPIEIGGLKRKEATELLIYEAQVALMGSLRNSASPKLDLAALDGLKTQTLMKSLSGEA